MPDLPISGLPALAIPLAADVFPIVNGGITKKTTVQNLGSTIFNQISSSVILPNQTGSFAPTSYYGSFYHTQNIVASALSTPTTMSLNTTDFSSGISISGSTFDKIKFASGGFYDIQFSAQLAKSTGTTSNVYIWIRKNNIDVPWSNTGVTLAGGSNDVATPAWNWFVSASAGIGGGPEVPSLIVTVNRVG